MPRYFECHVYVCTSIEVFLLPYNFDNPPSVNSLLDSFPKFLYKGAVPIVSADVPYSTCQEFAVQKHLFAAVKGIISFASRNVHLCK